MIFSRGKKKEKETSAKLAFHQQCHNFSKHIAAPLLQFSFDGFPLYCFVFFLNASTHLTNTNQANSLHVPALPNHLLFPTPPTMQINLFINISMETVCQFYLVVICANVKTSVLCLTSKCHTN